MMDLSARRLTGAATAALLAGLVGGLLTGTGPASARHVARTQHATALRKFKHGRAVALATGIGTGPPVVTSTPAPITRPPTTTTAPAATTTTAPVTTPTTAPVLRSGAELTEYAIHLTHATLDAGTIQVTATNYGEDAHNLTLSKDGVVITQTSLIQSRDADTLTADVSPGTYKLYCSLPGHEALGMHETLTVK